MAGQNRAKKRQNDTSLSQFGTLKTAVNFMALIFFGGNLRGFCGRAAPLAR